MDNAKKTKGFSVLEVVLSAALFSIFSVAIITAILQSNSAIRAGIYAQSARQYAMEGIEAARAVRAKSFDDLQNTSGSGIRFENGKWEFFGTEDGRDGFVRTISVQSAQRDGNGNIVSSGGAEDADLKLISVNVVKNNFSMDFSAYLSRREIVLNIP